MMGMGMECVGQIAGPVALGRTAARLNLLFLGFYHYTHTPFSFWLYRKEHVAFLDESDDLDNTRLTRSQTFSTLSGSRGDVAASKRGRRRAAVVHTTCMPSNRGGCCGCESE